MSAGSAERICTWCGRSSLLKNPIQRHSLASSLTLPFRFAKSAECKSCFNATCIQAAGDATYRATLAKQCETDEGRQKQRARTEQWEQQYDQSPMGRVRQFSRGLKETASVVNSSFLELEECLGILYPTKLAEQRLGRKATRTEIKVYQVGSMMIKGVVFREVVGEALPPGVFRLRRGASTHVNHMKEFDNTKQELREGQVAQTAASLAKRVLPCIVRQAKQVPTKKNADDDAESAVPGVVAMQFKGKRSTSSCDKASGHEGSSDDEVDLLGPIPSLVSSERSLKRSSEPNAPSAQDAKKVRTPPKPVKIRVLAKTPSETHANLGASMKVLLAQAQNLVDQVTTKGLLTVTAKTAMNMVYKFESKLNGQELHIPRAQSGDSCFLADLETKLRAASQIIRWAAPAIAALADTKGDADAIVAALVTMVKTAGSVGMVDYSLPEAVFTTVVRKLWFESMGKDWDDEYLKLISTRSGGASDNTLILVLGSSNLVLPLSKAALLSLQEETLVKSMQLLAKEAGPTVLYTTEHGREVTAFAKFEWLVRASAACADKLMVDGLGDDVLALNVAFTADADHDAVQKARHQLTESSKRLTTKPFKNSSALTECIAKLDSRSLAIKLNQHMETNLKKIIDFELADMSKLPSGEFHEVVEEHSQYVAAVASFKEAMAKAPPTFNQGFEKLIGDCE